MSDPDKLMTEAKAVLERAKKHLGGEIINNSTDMLVYEMAKVIAAIIWQEHERFGESA